MKINSKTQLHKFISNIIKCNVKFSAPINLTVDYSLVSQVIVGSVKGKAIVCFT